MMSFLESPQARLVLWCAGLGMAIAVAVYIVATVRGGFRASDDDNSDASELLTKFREIHAEGGLSDEEFRTIKTRLTDELSHELKGTGKSGSGD